MNVLQLLDGPDQYAMDLNEQEDVNPVTADNSTGDTAAAGSTSHYAPPDGSFDGEGGLGQPVRGGRRDSRELRPDGAGSDYSSGSSGGSGRNNKRKVARDEVCVLATPKKPKGVAKSKGPPKDEKSSEAAIKREINKFKKWSGMRLHFGANFCDVF